MHTTSKVSRPQYEFWWQALDAVPPSRDDPAYARLARIWQDQTRSRPSKEGSDRVQEFTLPTHETHLTVALWENFAVLPSAHWLPQLFEAAQLRSIPRGLRRVAWGYGWTPGAGRPSCDVALEYEDADGRGMVVVEAKNLETGLTSKDLDPGRYLDLPLIAAHERRALIYLVSERLSATVRASVRGGAHEFGVCAWEQLARVQIAAAAYAEGSAQLRAFAAAAIRRAYVDRGINVPVPPLPYLKGEPRAAEIGGGAVAPLTMRDWTWVHWRLT
jgi:hypothetical protein